MNQIINVVYSSSPTYYTTAEETGIKCKSEMPTLHIWCLQAKPSLITVSPQEKKKEEDAKLYNPYDPCQKTLCVWIISDRFGAYLCG